MMDVKSNLFGVMARKGALMGGALACLALVACAERGDSSQGSASSAAKKSYILKIDKPPKVSKGEVSRAEVSVIPQGEYKMNLEFPMKFSVTGPTGVEPQSLVMKAKDAAVLTAARLVLRPEIKLAAAGQHTFQGTLRFSVCTKKQCEMKTEQVKWVAESQ